MLKRFVAQLSKEMGFSKRLATTEDGTYELLFEPDLQISLRENADSGITLFTVVAALPAKGTEEYMVKLMSANLFGRETGGSALGLEKDGKSVTLSCFLPEGINYGRFHDCLEDFVNYADSWREETAQFVAQAMT